MPGLTSTGCHHQIEGVLWLKRHLPFQSSPGFQKIELCLPLNAPGLKQRREN